MLFRSRDAVAAARACKAWPEATAFNRSQVLYYLAENLSGRAEEFAARIAQLSVATDHWNRERDLLHEQIEQLQHEQSRADAAESSLRALQEQLTIVSQQLSVEQARNETAHSELVSTNAGEIERLQAVKNRLLDKIDENKTARQQWSDLEKQLRDQIAQQANAIAELQQQIEQERQLFAEELETGTARADSDRHAIESLQSQVAARVAELEETRRHLTKTTASLTNAENSVSELQLEQQSLQASNDQLAIELESERKRQQMDQEQLARMQQQHSADQDLIASLQDEVKQHAEQSADAQRRELALQQQFETTQRDWTSQAAAFEKQTQTAGEEQERLWNALETLENDLRKQTKLLQQVESERDRLRESELANRE